jgi:hypothetical protein
MNKKLEMCPFHLFPLGKLKVIASGFLCFKGGGRLREKGCECK